jgi:iron complex outermembrane receptor protein
LNVALEEDQNQLKEVVVQVGYGTVKKERYRSSNSFDG